MTLRFLLPYWGHEGTAAGAFLEKAVQEGWDGIEINIPEEDGFAEALVSRLSGIRQATPDFVFAAQLVPAWEGSIARELKAYENGLERLLALKPDFINAHTGRDFFGFEENCRFLESAQAVADKFSIPIRHETHRGRFSFHLPTLLPYLERYPELELTADLSHFTCVSESLLEGQEALLDSLFPCVRHLHARIGHEHGPQVSDPRAREWERQREKFLGWWDRLLALKKEQGLTEFTITPEFGPAPYMPAEPHTQKPLSDQHAVNLWMRDTLRERWADL